jgi:hypothetical protein
MVTCKSTRESYVLKKVKLKRAQTDKKNESLEDKVDG